MPLEIRELEIKTHIIQQEEVGMSPEEIELIVEECIERVMEVIKRKNEW